MKFLTCIALLMILSLALADCTKPKAKAEIACTTTISFRQDIIPIFNSYCAIPACHTGANPTGFLNLDSAAAYDNLRRGSYFHAYQPQYSTLYNKVTGGGGAGIMPPTGQLPASLTDKIYCWIQQGALDN